MWLLISISPIVLSKHSRYSLLSIEANWLQFEEDQYQRSIWDQVNSLIQTLIRTHTLIRSNAHTQIYWSLDVSRHLHSTSTQEKEQNSYLLTSVVVHRGSSANNGHYFSFGLSDEGIWWKFNDATSEIVPESEVLSQQDGVFMLFYRRSTTVLPKKSSFDFEPRRFDHLHIIPTSHE